MLVLTRGPQTGEKTVADVLYGGTPLAVSHAKVEVSDSILTQPLRQRGKGDGFMLTQRLRQIELEASTFGWNVSLDAAAASKMNPRLQLYMDTLIFLGDPSNALP